MVSQMEVSAPNKVARVLIVDDHPTVREGLALCISRQPHLQVCGEAADVAEALDAIATTNPDIVIVDISLRTGSGIDLVKRVRSRNPAVKMVVWSMFNELHYAERALRAGAMAYVNKSQPSSKIIEAIDRVLSGKVYLSDRTAEKLMSRVVGHAGETELPDPISTLSDREMEVFQLLGRCFDTRAISERLHISMKTVETYRARIKEKLQLGSATELLWQAMQWVQENA